MVKNHHFWVVGKGRFPLDMLRYDGCYPAYQIDVQGMIASLRAKPSTDSFSIEMRSHAPPTIQRWASFGWPVRKLI